MLDLLVLAAPLVLPMQVSVLGFVRAERVETLALAQGRTVVAYVALLLGGGSVTVTKERGEVSGCVTWGTGVDREVHELEREDAVSLWQTAELQTSGTCRA